MLSAGRDNLANVFHLTTNSWIHLHQWFLNATGTLIDHRPEFIFEFNRGSWQARFIIACHEQNQKVLQSISLRRYSLDFYLHEWK
jgi:hypothetical protein